MNAMASHRPTRGWRSGSTVGAVLVAASAWLSGSVWAANSSNLKIEFKGVQPSGTVSVSRDGLPVKIVYRVFIENPSTNPNVINQVVFKGTTNVAGYAGSINLLPGSSPNCAPDPSPVVMSVTSVSCQIGQLRSGDKREFFLLFQTPTADTTATDITFTGNTDFSEGNSSSSAASDFTKEFTAPPVALINTTDPDDPNGLNKRVRTVLSNGGAFFTGNAGAVNSSNKWSASVAIPLLPSVTSNEIQLYPDNTQSPPTSFACAAPYFCYGLYSTITIVDAVTLQKYAAPGDSYLIITLRQDASSLAVKNPFPAIGEIQIFYNPVSTSPLYQVGTKLEDCNGSLPTAGVPCIAGRDPSNLSKNKKSGWYEWTIHAKDNGRYVQ